MFFRTAVFTFGVLILLSAGCGSEGRTRTLTGAHITCHDSDCPTDTKPVPGGVFLFEQVNVGVPLYPIDADHLEQPYKQDVTAVCPVGAIFLFGDCGEVTIAHDQKLEAALDAENALHPNGQYARKEVWGIWAFQGNVFTDTETLQLNADNTTAVGYTCHWTGWYPVGLRQCVSGTCPSLYPNQGLPSTVSTYAVCQWQ